MNEQYETGSHGMDAILMGENPLAIGAFEFVEPQLKGFSDFYTQRELDIVMVDPEDPKHKQWFEIAEDPEKGYAFKRKPEYKGRDIQKVPIGLSNIEISLSMIDKWREDGKL